MAIKSVFWPQSELRDDLIHVTGDEHQHLRVSRTEKGECVELFDGVGQVMTGEVVEVNRSETRLKVVDERTVPPPRFEIILAQALIKNPAFERVVEKAVEVGVTRIIPFRASRSNESGQGRETRWRKIIVEAAKQSKHYHLPTLDPVTDLGSIAEMEASSRVVFAERREGDLATALTTEPVLYMIGPEGGWIPEELEVLEARGFGFVRLGSHIMRSETAAIVAGGLIAHHLGVL